MGERKRLKGTSRSVKKTSEIDYSLNGIISILNIAEESMIQLKDTTIVILPNEIQRRKDWKITESVTCGNC